MTPRNRATGWQYAKLSGHQNEILIKELLDTNPTYTSYFLPQINAGGERITATSISGLHETNVPSILPGKKQNPKRT